MKTNPLIVAMATLLLPLVPLVQAFQPRPSDSGADVKWPFKHITLHGAMDQFTEDSEFTGALMETVETWNLNPSQFRMYLEIDAGIYAPDDSSSQFWFSSDTSLLGTKPAKAFLTYDSTTGVMSEADIIFNSNQTWTTSKVKTDTIAYGGVRSFQNVVMHELGHLIGLAHESSEYNIMGDDWDHIHANGNRVNFYPGEDVSDGAVYLYGLATTTNFREDVGVVHWKYSGKDGNYSEHTRTEVYDEEGVSLSYRTDSNWEPSYEVEPGQTVYVEVTLENNGMTTQSPVMAFVWSENNLITTMDPVLDTRIPTLIRNDVYTITHRVVIPATAERGKSYYIGAIVDKDNVIEEINEENNATYVGVYVQ